MKPLKKKTVNWSRRFFGAWTSAGGLDATWTGRSRSCQLRNRLFSSTPTVPFDSKKRARKRTPPDRSLVTSTPGAVLQESLQAGRQMWLFRRRM
ncbi:unnamed protein product [Caenorhabditis auriculariae]|uniref:Uncharacterized protein n=1 Tax=Caenorhabditis auriculariae TaxID=2777116 RepID=A0A8S1HLF2_9PELO|nr:unnamed protein product [Caenorhabditis auriculariae]